MPKHQYDPQEHGAKCGECPLEGSRVVPPQIVKNSEILIAGEAPEASGTKQQRPMAGPSGKELDRALSLIGLSNRKVSITNALLCRPFVEKGNLRVYLQRLNKVNRERKEKGVDQLSSPLECCRPRLLRELIQAKALLLLGGAVRETIYGSKERGEEKLMSSRGFPSEIKIEADEQSRTIPCLSTVHPAYVLRSRRWTGTFRSDVSKAIRMSRGELTWEDPKMIYFPRPAELRLVLEELDRQAWLGIPTALDVETDGVEATTCNLRCIGIGNALLTTCVHFRSVSNPPEQHYNIAEEKEISKIIVEWLGDPSGSMTLHNGQYDLTVLRFASKYLPNLVIRRKIRDTCIEHHVAFSELRHDLGFLSAQYTDMKEHKAVDHSAWESDKQLHEYCMRDIAVTSVGARGLENNESLIAQKRVVPVDMLLSHFCRGLHEVGMHMDVGARDQQKEVMLKKMSEERDKIQYLACKSLQQISSFRPVTKKNIELAKDLNPNSHQQVGKFLFEICGVASVPAARGGYTDSGDPSVSRDNLFYLIDTGLTPSLEQLAYHIIDFKFASKMVGTYCNVEPMPDGRVRPTWNPHVVVTGRLSCSKPNVMNLPYPMRVMYDAEAGHLLAACDKAQLEARILAWLANDKDTIDAFLQGHDIHKLTACSVLGIKSVDEVTDKERKFAKTFRYAVTYGAGLERAHKMVRNFRDKDGTRPFSNYTMAQANVNYKRWWQDRAAVAEYNERGERLWRKQGYLEDAIHGRRRYFKDGTAKEVPREELANYRIQSTAAADVNDATKRVLKRFPWGFAGPCTGVVHYNYDSLMLEVPENMALEVGREVQQIMYSELGDMPLPVDLAIGKSWGTLKEIE
jgi:uracil-DNA glycosylase family 4